MEAQKELYRIRELILQIHRESVVQIVENEVGGMFSSDNAKNESLHHISELALEAKERIGKIIHG